MKFMNFVIMLALIFIAPQAWAASDVCRPLEIANLKQLLKTVSDSSCFQNRNLKDNTKQICECVSRITLFVPRLKEGKEVFNNRMLNAVQKNILTLATTQTKLEKDLGSRGKKKKDKSDVEDLLKESFPNESEQLTRASKKISENIHKFNYCGFSIDEYRRSARIPEYDLMNPADEGAQIGLWDDYLQANPDLLSIHVNLSEDKKVEFREKILDEFRGIKARAAPGQSFFNKTTVTGDKNNTNVSVANENPEDNLWLKLDDSFKAGGNIRGILSEYSTQSLKAQKENINRVKTFLDSGKDGFDIHYKYLLENDGAWDLFFNNTDSGQACSSATAKTISFEKNPFTCMQNISGFCALYDETKDKDVTKKLTTKMGELQFESLLTVEKSYDASIALFHKQGELICGSKFKLADVTDKNGKPLDEEINFERFKKAVCEENNIVIKESTKIDMKKVQAACGSKDNARLLGFFHRLVPAVEFSRVTNPTLKEGDFKRFKLSNIRSFIREKSRFDLPTENDEGNITTAVGSGNAKEARKVLATRIAEDRVYFENIRTSSASASSSGIINNKVTAPATNSALPTTAQAPVAAAEIPFVNNSGFASAAAVATAKNEQQQIVNEETKNIEKKQEQLSTLENKLSNDPSLSSSETARLEKQIQELRAQLVSSENRYQTAVESLKKLNQVAVSDNNDKSSTGNQVQRTQASTPNLNSDNNMVGSSLNNQGQSKLGLPAAQMGKLTTSGSGSLAGSTNKALLQANNVDTKEGSSPKGYAGLILQTVKNEKNEEIGLISDPKVFQKFKDKDKALYARYIQEMLDKNINTLIIKNGDTVLRYKLVGKDSDNYNLQEELGPISVSERKYFSRDLSNIINTIQ